MKKCFAALLIGLSMTTLPVVLSPATPVAHANQCPAADGDQNENNCPPPGTTPEVAGSIALADGADEVRQRLQGRPPCYSNQGVPYYTPGNAPCG